MECNINSFWELRRRYPLFTLLRGGWKVNSTPCKSVEGGWIKLLLKNSKHHFDLYRAPATAVRPVAPNSVPALAKEWERNTVDLWRMETDPGVSMKRGTSLAGHGLKTEKRSRKKKLALLLTILLTAVRRMKTLCHCSKVRDFYDFFQIISQKFGLLIYHFKILCEHLENFSRK